MRARLGRLLWWRRSIWETIGIDECWVGYRREASLVVAAHEMGACDVSKIALIPFDQMLKDWTSSSPPEWVRKARAERAELERTGARAAVQAHLDNTGLSCRNVGPATLVEDCRTHDCCYECNKLGGEGE